MKFSNNLNILQSKVNNCCIDYILLNLNKLTVNFTMSNEEASPSYEKSDSGERPALLHEKLETVEKGPRPARLYVPGAIHLSAIPP
jgi:hypothetical protein